MAALTHYVALAFKRSEEGGDILACDPKEVRSAEQAIPTRWLNGESRRTLRSHHVLADRRPGFWRFRGCGDLEDSWRGAFDAKLTTKVIQG
jgi:hypothetical protein